MKDLFIGLGSDFWENSIYIKPEHAYSITAEFIPTYVKLFPVVLSLLGAVFGYLTYRFYFKIILKFNLTTLGLTLYRFFNQKWYFDQIYNYYISKKNLLFGRKYSFEYLDRGILEYLGPYGCVRFINSLALIAHKLQSGYIYHYLFIFLLGLLSILVLVYLTILPFNLNDYLDIRVVFLSIISLRQYFKDISKK